jgi:hypothetical protein
VITDKVDFDIGDTQFVNIADQTGGTSDYNELDNKPQINGVELKGDKTLEDLGYVPYDDSEIKKSISDLASEVSENTTDIENLATNKANQSYVESFEEEVKQDYALKTELTDFITKSVDNLINYYTKSETYTQDEVKNLISQVKNASIKVVEELPKTGETSVIYFVLKGNSKEQDIYDEYVYVNEVWEHIGSTDIDLSDYITTEILNKILADYVKTVTLDNYAKKTDLPTKVSELENDEKFISSYTETDPTVPSYVKTITEQNITDWSNKATKKYVDDSLSTALGDVNTILATLTTPESEEE